MKNKLLLYLTAIVLALPLLIHGLIAGFSAYLSFFLSAAAVIAFMSLFMLKREKLRVDSLLDYSLLLFVLVYFISTFFAVSAKLAAVETLKYINYLFIFILVRHLSGKGDNKRAILTIIFAATVAVAVIGLGGAMSLIPYQGAFSQEELIINATMLNKDVFAVLSFLGILLGCGLFLMHEHKWNRYFYAIGGFLLFLGLMNAPSHSAWTAFILTFLAFISLSWRSWKGIAAYSLLLILPYLSCAKLFGRALAEQNIAGVLISLLLGLIVVAVLAYGAERIRKFNPEIKNTIGYIGTAAIAVAIIATLLYPTKILPAHTAEQLLSKQAYSQMMEERAAFYQDSFSLIKISPIIGSGGNAWSVAHPTHQSSANLSNNTLSYLMQVWLEAGTIGLILLLATILAFLYCAYIAICRYKMMGITVACGALMLLIGSMMELTFMIPSIVALFWALLAMLASMGWSEQFNLKIKITPYYIIGLAIIGLIANTMFFVALNYSVAGNEAVVRKDYAGASTVFSQAIRWNPIDDESRLSYIYVKLFMLSQGGEQVPGFVDEFNDTLRNVLSRGQQNVPIVAAAQVLYNYTSQTLDSVLTAEHLVEVQPLLPENYETLVYAYADHSNELLKNGDKEGTKTFLNYIIEVPNVMERLTRNKKQKVIPTMNTLLTIDKAKAALLQLEES